MEGILLKPNMVTSGAECQKKASHEEVGWYTVRSLSRSLKASVPAVTFLSGGSSESDATNFLNEINKVQGITKPW